VGFVLFADDQSESFMNTRRTTLPARFDPETHFDVPPVPAAPFRGAREHELEQLKQHLLRAALYRTEDADLYAPLRRAANEAAAVAWMTPFPLLFFPVLFEEKATDARRQFDHARMVRSRSPRLLARL
jgi:hypothetical protein